MGDHFDTIRYGSSWCPSCETDDPGACDCLPDVEEQSAQDETIGLLVDDVLEGHSA